MKAKKIIAVACIGLALVMVAGIKSAQAQDCCYFNPLLLPFAVAGAILGTAAAVVSAPFYPYYGPGYYGPGYYGPGYYAPAPAYYGPGPYPRRTVWIRGHYARNGEWIPRHRAWVRGYY